MPESLSANQLVGYNLSRIRRALGWSQEEAAARLEPYLGTRWSKAVYSAAERSYDGKRVRQFSSDELVAMSLAFGVPVAYFLLPPRPEDRPTGAVMVSGSTQVPWPQVIVAANGYQYAPAIIMRLRELPRDEQPEWPPPDPFAERYGLVPGTEERAAQRQAQPIVAAIVTSALGVLITARKDGKPPYGFVTGEIEPGELAEHAAVREVKEETGLEVAAGHEVGRRVHPASGRTMIYLAANPVRDTAVFVGDESELAEVRWTSLSEALELLPDMFGPAREHLARELGD